MKNPNIKHRNDLLTQLVQKFTPNAEEGTDFEAAFAANPQWRRELNWQDPTARDRCYAAASTIRRKLALENREWESARAARELAKTVSNGTPAGATQEEIIDRLIKDYFPAGKVDLGRAFREHPQWLAILGFADAGYKTVKPLYSVLRARRIKLGLCSPQKRAKVAPAASPQAPEPLKTPDPIAYCPSCGFSLRMFHTAFQIARKHSRP